MTDTEHAKVFDTSSSGIFIVNEGNFGSSTSSVDYYDPATKLIENSIISAANENLYYWGDVAQSMAIRNGLGYIVINNSGKVLVIDTRTFKVVGKITGLTSPRYIHFVSDKKAYVTDLHAKAISVIDIPSLQKVGEIKVNNSHDFTQHSTERMVQWGNMVFVACWMRDNKILVIDSEKDVLIDSITVAAQPNTLVIDKFKKLWVLCDGGYEGNPYAYEHPTLFRINLSTFIKEDSITFAKDDNPSNLLINASKDTLYFINKDIYSLAAINQAQPTPLIAGNSTHVGYGKGFYSLAIDKHNGHIYVADALDNAQPGVAYRFDKKGMPLDTFKVGINPNYFCFK